MDPEQRQCLELETHLLEARGETDNLKRQMLRMSASLESKEREVTELKSEVAQLKEELARLLVCVATVDCVLMLSVCVDTNLPVTCSWKMTV